MEKIEDKTMRKCSRCQSISKYKYMKRINGEILCTKCYQENRKARRKETIDKSGIKEKLIELEKRTKNEYSKRWRENQKQNKNYQPTIKGNKDEKKKRSNAYLTLEERQALLRILMNKGLDFEEAKQRIKNIVTQQAIVRKKLIKENKTEKEIKQRQKELLEELWLN